MKDYMRDALQCLDDFNAHNETELTLDELLNPYIDDHSSFDSFEELLDAAENSVQNDDAEEHESRVELTYEMLDEFINLKFEAPVTCLHSLLTQAMNYYNG